MKRTLVTLLSLIFCGASVSYAACNNMLDNEFKRLHSTKTVNLCEEFKGKVILAVNTASRCGFTPQFESLESLYQKYKDRGFVVLGFPSDDFNQEHADEAKTASVCYKNFGVTFPMMSTSPVKGEKANPFFKALATTSGNEPSWNFYKYLVDRDGKSVKSFSSMTKPDDKELLASIEALLTK